ncbi:MAG: hypothetical protein HUK21_03615 [Fibrobacteraceae bacterium]|nr:hypothetical protein [Fibrobacteraceae bacterium]
MKIHFFKKILFALCVIAVAQAFAVDPIWNMRYTFGPDSKMASNFNFGLGAQSQYNSNVLIPVNLIGAISKNFEIGAKVDIQTYDQMDHAMLFADFGGRYKFKTGTFMELDGYFGLNRNNGSAFVATLGTEQYVSKNFANYFEARAGFLDGVTGDDGYVKMSVGMTPTLIFGKFLRCMIEINSSASAGHLSDDFMMDIIPKFEIAVGGTRIRMDFDIGVLQESNNDQRSIGLYVMTSL